MENELILIISQIRTLITFLAIFYIINKTIMTYLQYKREVLLHERDSLKYKVEQHGPK